MSEDKTLLSSLGREIEPPDSLEDRVVETLGNRGLIGDNVRASKSHWRMPLAVAASVGLLAIGVLLGRVSTPPAPTPAGTLTGAETNVYALLLYENEEYDRPAGEELMSRYSEYSHWVAKAWQREQFITGEDLEADQGWLLRPSETGPVVESATTVAENAPLSGIFFIRANDPEHALDLARELPHLAHGGKVLVQRTLPTSTPPP